jgi:hypothetical protein
MTQSNASNVFSYKAQMRDLRMDRYDPITNKIIALTMEAENTSETSDN